MSDEAKPYTMAEAEALCAVEDRLIDDDRILATTRALEAEKAEREHLLESACDMVGELAAIASLPEVNAAPGGGVDAVRAALDALRALAEKAEARYDEARALMEKAFQGSNYERLRKDEWKALAEAAQTDVERLTKERAVLRGHLSKMVRALHEETSQGDGLAEEHLSAYLAAKSLLTVSTPGLTEPVVEPVVAQPQTPVVVVSFPKAKAKGGG